MLNQLRQHLIEKGIRFFSKSLSHRVFINTCRAKERPTHALGKHQATVHFYFRDVFLCFDLSNFPRNTEPHVLQSYPDYLRDKYSRPIFRY